MTVGAALTALERFLLPNGCVACGRAVGAGTPDALVCGVCRSRLRPVHGGCGRCHQPLPPVGPCRFCADWPEELRDVTSAVWLGDEAREILHHLKYDGLYRLGAVAASVMARGVRRAPPRSVLVPVPLSARRARERGYNQAEAIAAPLAARWGLPLATRLLMRVRHTRTQTALTPEARHRNVRDAFAAVSPPGGAGQVPGAVILVDDVLTTGATVVSAVHALRTAGWRRVHALTFARAPTFAERVR